MRQVELDEEQEYVVNSEESMVVVSGPGSGKTRILTEKARRVFNSGESVLCLTFTKSAAREMASRVPGLPATTIHSFCCGVVGWKVPPKGSNEDGYPYLLHRFLWEEDKPKFSYVLLDEAQDTNELEFDVVLSLVEDKLFAVGDPYQSIYGFQGAMGPKVVMWLKKMGCEEVELHNNYRSCPRVVNRLNRLFNRKLVSTGIKNNNLTAILCRTNDDVFSVSSFLKDNNIPHRLRLSAEQSDSKEYDVLGESNLRVNTVHQSKGLEYNHVALFDWFPDGHDEEETRIYYVAIARASRTFTEVSSLDELRSFLNGIND